MSKNTTHRKQSTSGETPRRPRTLGWIILAAGGFSTWYWYKPLPEDATDVAYSKWEHATRDHQSPWPDSGLLRPRLEDLDATPSPFYPEGNSVSSQSELSGTPTSSLVPAPMHRKNLDELIAELPQPEMREISVPTKWSKMEMTATSETIGRQTDRAASFSDATEWPDASYRKQVAEPRERDVPIPIPPLLNRASSPTTIQTQEDELSQSSHTRFPEISPHEEMPRTPQFIRQPKRK